jgi:hypothetical protein
MVGWYDDYLAAYREGIGGERERVVGLGVGCMVLLLVAVFRRDETSS